MRLKLIVQLQAILFDKPDVIVQIRKTFEKHF